jgi:hypothetical protein
VSRAHDCAQQNLQAVVVDKAVEGSQAVLNVRCHCSTSRKHQELAHSCRALLLLLRRRRRRRRLHPAKECGAPKRQKTATTVNFLPHHRSIVLQRKKIPVRYMLVC